MRSLVSELDHIAIQVTSIKEAVDWYKKKVSAEVIYEDKTWALIDVFNTKIALVRPEDHPTHIAFKTEHLKLIRENLDDCDWGKHRDGSEYVYLKDPFGNAIEWIKHPTKNDK